MTRDLIWYDKKNVIVALEQHIHIISLNDQLQYSSLGNQRVATKQQDFLHWKNEILNILFFSIFFENTKTVKFPDFHTHGNSTHTHTKKKYLYFVPHIHFFFTSAIRELATNSNNQLLSGGFDRKVFITDIENLKSDILKGRKSHNGVYNVGEVISSVNWKPDGRKKKEEKRKKKRNALNSNSKMSSFLTSKKIIIRHSDRSISGKCLHGSGISTFLWHQIFKAFNVL